MLRLWSQAARPQLACPCTACSSSATGILARRTASATTRRRLKLVDAFAILLAPVFATAFVADTIQKDRRRIEWDTRIAQVQGEVERLEQQESQILRSLSGAANLRRNTIHSTRSYCTDVRPRASEDNLGGEDDAPQWRALEWECEGEDDLGHASAGEVQEPSASDRQMTENTRDTGRRIERLVALKLAIRMLLHVRIGTSPRFNDVNLDYAYGATDNARDLDRLVDGLKTIRRSLHELNSPGKGPDAPTLHQMPQREQATIDEEICHHTQRFRLGNLSIAGLVKRIGDAIFGSSEPPSVNAYVPLMTTLSRARLDELAYLVMSAMDESRVRLSNHSVLNIIWQYGKNRDANRFEQFLKSVTSVGATAKYTESWEWKVINDVEVPCPSSNDPRLLQILIYTALKCNQPHRAQAWLSQLTCSDSPPRHASHVLRNFMKFYATNRDWQRGQAWLSASLDWSASLGPNVIRDLQRVVFAMLELCVACGKQDAYHCILQAAVRARIGVFRAEADLKFTERSKSILAEWERLHHSVPTGAHDDILSVQRKAQTFCDEVTPMLGSLGLTEIPCHFEWPTPRSMGLQFGGRVSGPPSLTGDSATEWRELYLQQATELKRLKAELAELDWRRLKIAGSEAGGLQSRAVVSPSTPAERPREQHGSSPLLDVAPKSQSNSLSENLASPSTQKGTTSPLPFLDAPPMCGTTREISASSIDVGQAKSVLARGSAALLLDVADSIPKGDARPDLEDRDKAGTTRDDDSSFDKKPEWASAQERPMHGRRVESVHVESPSNLGSHIRPDSVQSNVLTEFPPFATAARRLDREMDPFHKQHAYSSRSDPLNGPIGQAACLLNTHPGSSLSHLAGKAAGEPFLCSSTLSTTPASVSDSTEELRPSKPSKPSRKAKRASFLRRLRAREASARATLRYVHAEKPVAPKPTDQPQEQFLGCKDKAARPYTVLLLDQLPPKAVKWVNGEFRPRSIIAGSEEYSKDR